MLGVPNLQIIKKFLLSQGWTIEKKDGLYQYFSPSSEYGFVSSNFHYALPLHEDFKDYQEYIYRIVASIAEVHKMNKWYLLSLFSQSLEEIKEDVELKRALLAA
ncbi:MAG: hypothetical protein AAF806_05460 [Bacteroidota bacterium]